MLKDLIAKENENKQPIYQFIKDSKILIVGQAPGPKTEVTFKDKSGERLKEWLGVTEEEFRTKISLLPMDFYFPGKGKTGDLPPRKGFAEKWHPVFLEQMDQLELIILVGSYAMKYYLNHRMKKNLTETVRNYKEYLPEIFPIVHPSPLNIRWLKMNPWFEQEVIIDLKQIVRKLLSE